MAKNDGELSKRETELVGEPSYTALLEEIRREVRASRVKAAKAVNTELIAMYWRIGKMILDRQEAEGWGAKVIEQLAVDLKGEGAKGFSRSNLHYMRAFAEAWEGLDEIVQQPVGQIPWGQNVILLTKLNNPEDRLWYAERAATEGWSRKVLEHHIATDLKGRQGLAPSNFDRTLPPADSDMAKEMLSDPLDASFVAGEAAASERDLEPELIAMYWRIGKMILDRQEAEGWGAKVIEQLAADLKEEGARGFSERNLRYMRAFAEAWPQPDPEGKANLQTVSAEITWSQHQALLDKLETAEDRLWYAERAAAEGWSVRTLRHHIATDLKGRQGLAPSNFDRTLPPADSDMAKEMLSDPLDASFVAGGKPRRRARPTASPRRTRSRGTSAPGTTSCERSQARSMRSLRPIHPQHITTSCFSWG